MISVRPECTADRAGVRRINEAAFPSPAEADLVDALRAEADPIISLVAADGGGLTGHIMFSPMQLDGYSELKLMGLAPMAVTPDRQGTGIGSALVKAGLEACRAQDVAAIFVLGHPGYYPRFGFVPAPPLGLNSVYDVPEDTFMLMELQSGALADKAGRVHYHPAFDRL